MRYWLSALCGTVTVATMALGADQRDDAIFGDESAAKPAPETPLVETTQVGGRLEINGTSSQSEHQKFPEAGFSQLKVADLFLDARPNKDMRAFVRARFSEETPVNAKARAAATGSDVCDPCVATALDEAWFKWDYQDSLFMTFGKQHLKWGSGRFWNPTDFTATAAKDPFSNYDRRLGKDLFKLHLPFEKQGHNLYAVVEMGDAEKNDDMGLALRGEFAFAGSGEAAFTFEHRPHHPVRAGADVSAGLGPVDVNVEAAATRKDNHVRYVGEIDPSTMTLPGVETPDEQKTLTQVVTGLQYSLKYSDDDSVTFGGEFFLNDLGYDDRDLELYALVKGAAEPLYAGRRYAGAFVRLPQPGSLNNSTYYLTGLRNLSDGTAVARLTGAYDIHKNATLEIFVSRCFGDYGEFCFRVPDSYGALAASPKVSEADKQLLLALPTRRSLNVAGVGMSMGF